MCIRDRSLAYVLIYFLRGSLPWSGLKAANKKLKYEKIQQKKSATPTPELCRGFPEEFQQFLDYARSLTFGEIPDYTFLHTLLATIVQREQIDCDGVFDWELAKQRMEVARSPVAPRDSLMVCTPEGQEVQAHNNTTAKREAPAAGEEENRPRRDVLEACAMQMNDEPIRPPQV
eukprot:TRINITY_DN8881_c0_g1_i2.p1 TRINITY_DN8881_c0_g1~~TRINITY_DN8881_c0_g1_i2.p1  ORF type:complete len:174 (-),score=45.30 TRINITY_DN8881_c0_g1_i2:251-772(-)